MPFSSARQRRFLYKNHPEVAKKFEQHSDRSTPESNSGNKTPATQLKTAPAQFSRSIPQGGKTPLPIKKAPPVAPSKGHKEVLMPFAKQNQRSTPEDSMENKKKAIRRRRLRKFTR